MMASVTMCKVCDTDLESDPNIEYMKELLPPGFQHCVCSVAPIAPTGFCGRFCVECSTVEDTQRWIAAFQEHSKMTFRVSRTRPSSGHRVLYNYEFRCMHNIIPRSTTADLKKSSKNKNCPAVMTVRLLRSEFKQKCMNSRLADYKRKSQSKDLHLPKYPLRITLDVNHNHAIHGGDALRCRDVGPEARRKIECLLRSNHSPSSALKVLKQDLQAEHPEDYLIYVADRRHCPDLNWCYRLYYDILQKQHGPASGSVQLDDLQHHSDKYNQSAADGTEQMPMKKRRKKRMSVLETDRQKKDLEECNMTSSASILDEATTERDLNLVFEDDVIVRLRALEELTQQQRSEIETLKKVNNDNRKDIEAQKKEIKELKRELECWKRKNPVVS